MIRAAPDTISADAAHQRIVILGLVPRINGVAIREALQILGTGPRMTARDRLVLCGREASQRRFPSAAPRLS